jgi:hypothetical protein
MLRAARELLAVRSPLDAELMVSELLGTWWGQRGVRGTGVEQLIGEGLVDYAATQSSPAALALLSGIALLGTPRQAVKAERAAIHLMDGGVPCPAWASHLGEVTAAECYVNPDAFGDQDEVICVFSYKGEEPHALVSVIDYNKGGMIRDGWVTSRVSKLLDHCKMASAQRGATGRQSFREVDAPAARRMLESALRITDSDRFVAGVSESFPSYHAFVRSRVRALPPYRGRGPAGTTGAHRRIWSRDRRAMVAAEFLASDEAEDLSDRGAASHCADRIIDYGCDHDFGRPERMSPTKVETFLLSWLPRKVMLSSAEQDAMPHVLGAWVRWTGRRRSLPDAMIAESLETVFNSMRAFAEAYRDPAEFGLEYALVRRLLPDGDLEALPRRAFAFPVLEGLYKGVDLSELDPADPSDRRALLAADHTTPKTGDDSRHIDRHLALADRLWRGDPPELWEAAQRLLDAGQERHLVLHDLMDLLESLGADRAALVEALRDLMELRFPVTSAAGRLDDEDVVFAHAHRVAAVHRRDRPVRMLDPVAAQRAWFAAVEAKGRNPAVPGQRGQRHRLKEPDLPDSAIAALVLPRAAGAVFDAVALHPHRVAPLQHLGVGEPGVRHLGLHHVCAVEARPGARPAGHRLVILMPLVTERHIVHRPRSLGLRLERAEQRSCHRL